MTRLQKNTTLLEMDGWMGRLAFILNGLKAMFIVLIPAIIFVYVYLQFNDGVIESGTDSMPSALFLTGAGIIGMLYYALIYPSVVKRLTDIVGPEIKKPRLLALIIIIGLNIPIVGFITGLVLSTFPGKISAKHKD